MEKAWNVFVKNIVSEPWHYNDLIVYAETRNQARSKAMSKMLFESAEIEDQPYSIYNRYRDVEYKDISATRNKELDKVDYNGEEVSKSKLKEIKWCEERTAYAKSLANNFPDKTAVVYTGSYGSFWGANHSGYASNIIFAGLYTTKEAYDIVKSSSYDRQETVRLYSKEDKSEVIDLEVEKLQKEIDRLNTYR